MSALNRFAVIVIEQEAAGRGWSRKKLCAKANIRRKAMKGRTPLSVNEIGRAGAVMGIGGFELLIQITEGWERVTAARPVMVSTEAAGRIVGAAYRAGVKERQAQEPLVSPRPVQ